MIVINGRLYTADLPPSGLPAQYGGPGVFPFAGANDPTPISGRQWPVPWGPWSGPQPSGPIDFSPGVYDGPQRLYYDHISGSWIRPPWMKPNTIDYTVPNWRDFWKQFPGANTMLSEPMMRLLYHEFRRGGGGLQWGW